VAHTSSSRQKHTVELGELGCSLSLCFPLLVMTLFVGMARCNFDNIIIIVIIVISIAVAVIIIIVIFFYYLDKY